MMMDLKLYIILTAFCLSKISNYDLYFTTELFKFYAIQCPAKVKALY